MSSLYTRISRDKSGQRALSAARLRYEVLKVLNSALQRSNLSQTDLAARLGVRKSAVNQVLRGDGNVTISTLAEYLHELGHELEIEPVPLGKPREDAVRAMNQALVATISNVPSDSRHDLSPVQWRHLPGQDANVYPMPILTGVVKRLSTSTWNQKND